MTTDEIRNIDIVAYLAKRGYHPKRSTGNTAMYLSPFTKEKEPSFTVKKSKNRFHDYSSSSSGSVIDFVMKYDNVDFLGAIRILNNGDIDQIETYTPPKVEKNAVEVHSVGAITDGELIDYACGVRKISEEVLHKFCVQISISFPFSKKDNVRQYTLLGFKSDAGGYECRSSWMKICAGNKSHTTIKGKSKDKCIVTEGFFDALSYFTYYGILEPEYTFYCLNGAGQFGALNNFIGDTPVKYYGDNDRQGDIIASEIQNIDDKRHVYVFYKDMGKFLEDNY